MSIQKVRQLVPAISLDETISACAKVYHTSLKRVFSLSEYPAADAAIDMCIYLATHKTNVSTRSVAEYFGVTQARVIRSRLKVRRLMGQYPIYFNRMEKIIAIIG